MYIRGVREVHVLIILDWFDYSSRPWPRTTKTNITLTQHTPCGWYKIWAWDGLLFDQADNPNPNQLCLCSLLFRVWFYVSCLLLIISFYQCIFSTVCLYASCATVAVLVTILDILGPSALINLIWLKVCWDLLFLELSLDLLTHS